MFDSTYLQQKNGKIDVSDALNSQLDNTLNCLSYIFPKELKIKSVYSKTAKKATGIKFEPYGSLVSYELMYKDKRLFRVKRSNSPYIGWTITLEALQDRLSMDNQVIKTSGEFTIITEEFTRNFNSISEYKFLLAPIEHTSYEENQKYTAHTYIEDAKVDRKLPKFQLEHIRGLMQQLDNLGLNIKYSKSNSIYELKTNHQ